MYSGYSSMSEIISSHFIIALTDDTVYLKKNINISNKKILPIQYREPDIDIT